MSKRINIIFIFIFDYFFYLKQKYLVLILPFQFIKLFDLHQLYNSNQKIMAFPVDDIYKTHYYQGVLIVQVALTFLIYLVLKFIHYIKWGHQQQIGAADQKKDAQQDSQSRKWDQKAWNVYFPIIFTNHIGAIALIIIYIPYTFSAVIGFLHFVCFLALIILNICIKDSEPGNGSRTKGSRVVWGLMCFFNILLIIGGLTGVQKVYKS